MKPQNLKKTSVKPNYLYPSFTIFSHSRAKKLKFRCCGRYITTVMWGQGRGNALLCMHAKITSWQKETHTLIFPPRAPEVPLSVKPIVLQKRAAPPLWASANWDGVYINGFGEKTPQGKCGGSLLEIWVAYISTKIKWGKYGKGFEEFWVNSFSSTPFSLGKRGIGRG